MPAEQTNQGSAQQPAQRYYQYPQQQPAQQAAAKPVPPQSYSKSGIWIPIIVLLLILGGVVLMYFLMTRPAPVSPTVVEVPVEYVQQETAVEKPLLDQAIQTLDSSKCSDLGSVEEKDYCYYSLAQFTNSPDLCREVIIESGKNISQYDCFAQLGMAKRSSSFCNSLHDAGSPDIAAYCIFRLAQSEQNANYCEEIRMTEGKFSVIECKKAVAVI